MYGTFRVSMDKQPSTDGLNYYYYYIHIRNYFCSMKHPRHFIFIHILNFIDKRPDQIHIAYANNVWN